MSNFILWLSEINNDNQNLVGEKFFSLSKLYQSKFPVPSAFCVTKEAFSYFLECTGLNRKINEIRSSTENRNDVSYAIQELIVEAEIPLDLKKEIEEAYENINVDPAVQNTGTAFSFIKAGRDSSCVVVRTSGNFDNNAKNTLLNVKGSKNLIYSLKKVWALQYNIENFNNLDDLSLATLVQKMVSPAVSGSFSFKDDDLIINAVHGFLDSEVKDKADVYKLDRNSLYVKDKSLNLQDSKLVKDDMIGSIVLRQITNPGNKLSDNDLGFIAQVAKKMEQDYSDKEITFAVEGPRLYFLNVKNKKEEIKVEMPIVDTVIPDFMFNSEPLTIPEEKKEEVQSLSSVEVALIEAKLGDIHIKLPKDKKSLEMARNLLDLLSSQV